MKFPNLKKSAIKLATGLILLSFIIGTVSALNGWFGGGGKIPEDTFTRGLVAYWSFDEGSGNIAYDASGNGNHGTLINGPKWTQGKIGQALSFDGVDDYVDTPLLQNSVTEYTIEAWIKTTKNQGVIVNALPAQSGFVPPVPSSFQSPLMPPYTFTPSQPIATNLQTPTKGPIDTPLVTAFEPQVNLIPQESVVNEIWPP